MTTIGATDLRNNLFKMLESCIKYNKPINVSTKNGNIIMISEEEYRGWKETVEICGVKGLEKELVKAKKSHKSDYIKVNVDEL
jgi:PHD/YefM family antitoxin component YafN of YafNO toxin-antitoxin module